MDDTKLRADESEAIVEEGREAIKRLAAAKDESEIRTVAKAMSPGLVDSIRNTTESMRSTVAATRQFVDTATAYVDSPIPGMGMTEYRYWKKRMAVKCHRRYVEIRLEAIKAKREAKPQEAVG